MSTELRAAAELAEERLDLAAKVQTLRNELISADDETRHQKSEEFDGLVTKLESVDREYQFAERAEKAEQLVKNLSRQPQRPAPVAVTKGTGFVSMDPRTGQVTGGSGFQEVSDDEARGSYEYKKAFDSFLKSRGRIDKIGSSNHRDILERYGKSSGMEENEFFMPFTKDMTIATTTNGSNAIAPDFRNDIITPRTVTPVMSRICNVITTSVTNVKFPRNADANSDTRYGTSFRPTKGETPNATQNCDTGPFTQLSIDVNTGTMYTDVSSDFLDDASGMSAYINREAAKAFAAVVDNEVINGNTSLGQAEGVLLNSSVGITKTGTNNTLVATKIVEGFYAFREQYGSELAWVTTRGTHGGLVALLDANNRSLFMPSVDAGYIPGAPKQLLGAPLYYNEFCPATGTSLPKSIIVGDWMEYFLLMRQGYSLLVDTVSRAAYNRTRMVMKYRFGGAVRDPKAFRIIHESA